VKRAARSLGFKQLPELEEESANGMTAVSDTPFHLLRLFIYLFSYIIRKGSRQVIYYLVLLRVTLSLPVVCTLLSKV